MSSKVFWQNGGVVDEGTAIGTTALGLASLLFRDESCARTVAGSTSLRCSRSAECGMEVVSEVADEMLVARGMGFAINIQIQ